MDWVRILAYITGTVDQELLLRNEYLAAENRILKAQLKTPLRLTDAERITLAEIAHRLGRKALDDVANAAKPDTIMGWYRRLVARKFDGSKSRCYPGRPRIDDEIEQWVVRMAKENADWGYDRIVGAMANLGYKLSDQTVGNILQRHGIPPAPARKRTTTWADFIRAHMSVLAGTDFFTVEVLTLRGLVTYYVLFCATRGRTRIYQGSLRSGVLPPVPYRAVHWGQPQGAKRSGQCSLRPVGGRPNREGTLRLLASGQLGARVEGYDQCK
ncbi:MAG: helix-turn-helix domain-containing protein [Thiogranum sp.]